MSCAKGRASPNRTTQFRLFADSGGYCQNPSCLQQLFRDEGGEVIHIAEMAHIIAASDVGPRADSTVRHNDRASYENLILLCPTCHTVIDKADQLYPSDEIVRWKQHHYQQIKRLFGAVRYETREDAKMSILPLFRENRAIFDIYGPDLPSSRFNPESDLPRQWRNKIRSRIIPNSRKALAIFDLNTHLLTESEQRAVEHFRQHVEDLERKHILNEEIAGIRFPISVVDTFA